jgi:TolB-like protein/Tfp pilus assembly protein PilF
LLACGIRIGRYEVLSRIGAGGMGEVYRARDLRLGREVALKVLDAGLLQDAKSIARFEQEARLAGSLDHPNVLAVHDVGDHEGKPYLVSELLEGVTLREQLSSGPLSPPRAVAIALQIAQGLAAAHEKGIVHRDLKPENIFLTRDGRTKILDFGIAKLLPAVREHALTKGGADPQTMPGTLIGTVAYMSPEQVRGEAVDARSDLFSFGCVLYELVSGRSPFAGNTPMEKAAAVLHRTPPPLPLEVPPALASVVGRCLQKSAGDRFQTARDLIFEVQELVGGEAHQAPARGPGGALLAAVLVGIGLLAAASGLGWYFLWRGRERPEPQAARAPSIAVLPFANLSGEKENEYFSDGMTEELINALANVEGIRVVARTSAFAYKGKNVNVRQIGEELNVATVLEGSVRRQGSQLRVVAQLIGAADGYHLWSKTYDRELKNVFSVEDELARAIVQALKPKLVPAAPLVLQATASTEAHDLYLKGRFLWNQRTKEGLTKAVAFFEQALALDPKYAPAHSGLSDCYILSGGYGVAWTAESLQKARKHALEAVRLDESLAEGHTSLANVAEHDFDWTTAEREYKRALQLGPGYAIGHQWYAVHLLNVGRLTEAQVEVERARQLDPTSLIINNWAGIVFYFNREYDRAIEQSLKTLELDPGWWAARANLVLSCLLSGRLAKAQAAVPKATSAPDRFLALRVMVLAAAGEQDAARRLLSELDRGLDGGFTPRVRVAEAHLSVGDKDGAFFWLERGVDERSSSVLGIKSNPNLDSIRSDPRYHKLLKRMNLE